jgi:hypothetical protein
MIRLPDRWKEAIMSTTNSLETRESTADRVGRLLFRALAVGMLALPAFPAAAFSARQFSAVHIGSARMTSCPKTTPEAPYPAETPFTFRGVVPHAPKGTRLRIEFTNPNSPKGKPVVVHLRTDAKGRFRVTHSFPYESFVYGAEAIPRYPDKPLATGKGCDFEIQ